MAHPANSTTTDGETLVNNPTGTDNKSVLITGCSSGIGQCVALGLHARGYRVFASVRNPDDLGLFAAQGIDCLLLDYNDSASIDSAVDRVFEQTGGRLYALFNNGAYGQPGACEDLSRAEAQGGRVGAGDDRAGS